MEKQAEMVKQHLECGREVYYMLIERQYSRNVSEWACVVLISAISSEIATIIKRILKSGEKCVGRICSALFSQKSQSFRLGLQLPAETFSRLLVDCLDPTAAVDLMNAASGKIDRFGTRRQQS
ncbi:hypothetical protein LMH87_007468 [Akanthomyces muscarius]|uniref:Uncharacterized protein n=1 Tax=Akanthomyces muscarius TaxID=2231603 RepID=A0A9W8QPR2_AKAMU|nr:hypothetical protein LMH87_007468 [Akanthomyces muscarius]KAJ4165858.1 hypothetical protein LMH87_007468 [Akanthomyces muscarius]